ncbi:hypothetical protein ACFLSI_06515 [Bacteroidota bacterium]
MKKHLIFICLFILILPINSFAGKADLFSYNKVDIETVFADLNELEDYLRSNEGTSLSTLNSSFDNLTSSFPVSATLIIKPPFSIPSIVWGFFLGPVGVVLVYFITKEDNDETKKSIYGCVASGVLWAALAIIPNLIGASSSGCSGIF